MKRAGRVWIRVSPDVPVSKKPAEVRMGSGKGAPEYWVAKIKPGRILFEIDGVDTVTAKEALRLGASKLSIVPSSSSAWRNGEQDGKAKKSTKNPTTADISARRPRTNSAINCRS